MTNTKPQTGQWYVNLTGQLIKVSLICYKDKEIQKIGIEYLNGKKQVITASDWRNLDLEINIFKGAVK